MCGAPRHVSAWPGCADSCTSPGVPSPSPRPTGLRAGFGVRSASLLGGDIRQKLLPISGSVPKPGFRSAKGFLPSVELEHRQRQNRNVCIFLGELPGVALCVFLRCGWGLVAGCRVWCFSLLVRSVPGRVSCFRGACLPAFLGVCVPLTVLSSTSGPLPHMATGRLALSSPHSPTLGPSPHSPSQTIFQTEWTDAGLHWTFVTPSLLLPGQHTSV